MELAGRLDPFGHDRHVRLAGERDQRSGERPKPGVAVDAPGEGDVHLHHVGRELQRVTEARVARADVVHGDAKAALAEGRERLRERAVVLDGLVFRDLQDDAFLDAVQPLDELGRCGGVVRAV
jgi:hypothetical protein